MGNSNGKEKDKKCAAKSNCGKKCETGIHTHSKALGKVYADTDGSTIDKYEVPADKIAWNIDLPDYKPVKFTIKFILDTKPFWADPDVDDTEAFSKIKFNELDGAVNRVSFYKEYEIIDGVPRNPIGRTGICGRGQLGKWGPNHAADPIVTRWKRDEAGNIVNHADGKQILEFVAIQRKDTKEWAIPGGMVDADEEVSLAMKREFGEEALNSIEEEQKEETKKNIERVFKSGEVIYKGYVDDPRNTDNAWMETVASNFHDDTGKTVGKIPLSAGDDAQAVRWLSIDGPLSLYASHSYFIQQVCQRKNAYFAAAAAAASVSTE